MNPWEAKARAAKVDAMAGVLDAAGIEPAKLAETLEGWPEEQWLKLSALAELKHPPSADTRRDLVKHYRERAELQARFAPRRCPMGHVGCRREACAEEAGIRAAQGGGRS